MHVPYSDQIGIRLPGENEPIFFGRDPLKLHGVLAIKVIKKNDPQGYGVELISDNVEGQNKIIYIHNIGE